MAFGSPGFKTGTALPNRVQIWRVPVLKPELPNGPFFVELFFLSSSLVYSNTDRHRVIIRILAFSSSLLTPSPYSPEIYLFVYFHLLFPVDL
jgi:hypothetical protein